MKKERYSISLFIGCFLLSLFGPLLVKSQATALNERVELEWIKTEEGNKWNLVSGVPSNLDPDLQAWIRPSDILLTAANPAARQVRHEWPDGSTTEDWEVPPANVSTVSDRLKTYLTDEAFQSIMQNILLQAAQAQQAIAQFTIYRLGFCIGYRDIRTCIISRYCNAITFHWING